MTEMTKEDASLNDLIPEMDVRALIERGLAESNAGQTVSVSEIREEYGLSEQCENIRRDSPQSRKAESAALPTPFFLNDNGYTGDS